MKVVLGNVVPVPVSTEDILTICLLDCSNVNEMEYLDEHKNAGRHECISNITWSAIIEK